MSASVQLKGGGEVAITHANSDKNTQIFMAAEAIWGITADNLPQAKFDELKTVLVGNLTREYGTYRVQGFGDTFVLFPLKASQKSPCSLDTCMVADAAFRCGKCQKAMYCSKEHQRQDWPRHKVECISQK
jgi:hypothetical protein